MHNTKLSLEIERYLKAITENWPMGFNFSGSAIRLLESRCGALPHGMLRSLKDAMFCTRGKLWFTCDSFANKEVQEKLVSDAHKLVTKYKFVSFWLVVKSCTLTQVTIKEEDAGAFVWFLLRHAGFYCVNDEYCSFVSTMNVATQEDIDQKYNEWKGVISAHLRAFIAESGKGNSVPEKEVLEAFPNFDADTLLFFMDRYTPDIIPEQDTCGNLFYKRIEDYYLPDDIGDVLAEIINAMDAAGTVPTSSAIELALSSHYDCNFAQDYALDPSYSFKWVLEAIWRKHNDLEPRIWKGDGSRAKFVSSKDNTKDDTTSDFLSKIEASFNGIFTNEEYWDFMTKQLGFADSKHAKIAQLRYLTMRFIRLNRNQWMSIQTFQAKAKWDTKKAQAIATVLKDVLGTAPFLPVKQLGNSIFDALPELPVPLRWTHELLASVAALLVTDIEIANHGQAPFEVTALVVPNHIDPDDIVTYVLDIYCARNPHSRSVENAFAFLKEANVRIRLTKKLRDEIQAHLAKQETH